MISLHYNIVATLKISKYHQSTQQGVFTHTLIDHVLFCCSSLGKQRHIRLIPVGALDGHDVEWIKVSDTKGCLTFDTACHSQGCSSNYVFCIALKRQVSSLLSFGNKHLFLIMQVLCII